MPGPLPGYLFLPPLLFPDLNPIIRTRLRFQEGRKNLKTQMGSCSVFLTQGLGLMRLKDGRRQRVCVQFSSVTLSCPTLCDPMDCSTPGLPVHHQLPEATQTRVHCVGDAIQPSQPVGPFSSCLQSFPAPGSFPTSQIFPSGSQIIGVSASASALPMDTQGLFPLGLTGLISLLSKGLSRVFSSTTM